MYINMAATINANATISTAKLTVKLTLALLI